MLRRSRWILMVLGLLVSVALAACGGGHRSHAVSASAQQRYQSALGQRAHSPMFGLPPRGAQQLPRASAAGTLLMLDTTDAPSQIFSGLSFQAVAGYTSGYWPTWGQMIGRYAHVVGIAVNVGHYGYPNQCLDVEPGDATPDQSAYWVSLERQHGIAKPCEYSDLSEWGDIDANLRAHGIDPHSIFRWLAYWVYVPELLPGWDAQQWTDHYANRNIDGSQVTPAFVGISPGPPPNPLRIFPTIAVRSPFGVLRERDVVAHYLGARVHCTGYHRCLDAHHRNLAPYIDRVLRPELRYLAGRIVWLERHVWHGWASNDAGPRFQFVSKASQGRLINP